MHVHETENTQTLQIQRARRSPSIVQHIICNVGPCELTLVNYYKFISMAIYI